MAKNKYHQTDKYHMIYLGEISWKVHVTPQVDTRAAQVLWEKAIIW